MTNLKHVFFIVGPTATGKSELAAEAARQTGAEIVSADAFQIYCGLDLLSAKPDGATLAKVPHHLIGQVPIAEEMNAEKFRTLARRAIGDVQSRGKPVIVVGGSGLYLKALTHGLSVAAAADPDLRAQLNELSLADLQKKLRGLDPNTVIDLNNRRRVVRAIEICLLSGKPASEQRREWNEDVATNGVFVFRDRDDLYERINRRVEKMFESGVIEEVRRADAHLRQGYGGQAISETASKMIGFREIGELLDGKMSPAQCVAAIQRATRRYAKRQLTWFRRQTNFQSLNLSLLTTNEAVKGISRKARLAFAQGND